MTRDIDYQISVMQAFKEGKKIEWHDDVLDEWKETIKPAWDWCNTDYRIKKEPKYVPYKNTEELIEDFCKRSRAKRSPMGEPFIWVKDKETAFKQLVTDFGKNNVISLSCTNLTLAELFENYTFLNGTPCGKKVE